MKNDALRIGQAYVTAAAALQENTAAVTTMINNGLVSTAEFQQIWRQRDKAYSDWNNAALLLRDLPVEGAAVVLQEIERMQAACV